MKKFKQWISVILACCMCLSLAAPTVLAADANADIALLAETDSRIISEGTFQGHTYQLWNESMTWTEAKTFCENMGGHLVTITSEAEQEFLSAFIQDKSNLFWIGLHFEEGNWEWITGEPVSYTNWGEGEPNSDFGNTEFYVDMYGRADRYFHIGEWNDARYDGGTMEFYRLQYIGFICEYECSDNSPYIKEGTFSYLSYDNHVREYDYIYDESWFFNSSYEYQHDLTKMSIRVAMAAGDVRAAGEADGARPIKELMNDLEFTYSEKYSRYPEPGYDSIGYGIGSKEITSPSGEKSTLIMVAIRGSGYGLEWGGNFRIGTGIDHEGFRLAADQVIMGLEDYINANAANFQPDIKVWISGYSRAAATANLVAAYLDDGFVTQVTPENVFAFCFECPQNTTNNQAVNAEYDNIVNVVNPIDLVPKVAMGAWGFRRYGTTYYLPSAETTASYNGLKLNMQSEYSSVLSYLLDEGSSQEAIDNLKVPDITREEYGQASALDDLVDDIAVMLINQNNYQKYYQEDIVKTIGTALGQGLRPNNLCTIIQGVPALAGNIFPVLAKYRFVDGHDLSAIGLNSHYMELCLAWLDSLDGLYQEDYSSVCRRVFINCPVDVFVYDSSSQLVAKIADNTVYGIENGVGAYIDSNGQKIIVLPADEKYDIQLSATGTGTMTYTVTEYDMDTAESQRVVSYCEVSIAEGDELYGTVENLEEVSAAKYPLALAHAELAIPTIDQTGDEVVTYTVEAFASDGGTAVGGGAFVGGEYAQVIAACEENYSFDGWYVGDDLVSAEAEYRFLVDSNTTVIAKFTEISSGGDHNGNDSDTSYYPITVGTGNTENGSVSVDKGTAKPGDTITVTAKPDEGCRLDDLIVTDMNGNEIKVTSEGNGEYTFKMPSGQVWIEAAFVKAELPFTDVFPNVYYYDAVKWAVENGVTTGTSATTFSPDATCTRAQTVTFLWRAAGSPAPESAEMPFADVAADAYYYDAVLWAVEQGITNGTSATTFSPDATVSRAQVVTFLWRAEKFPVADVSNPFTDVEADIYYTDAVLWAVKNGITTGTSAVTFSPNDSCTRAQIVTFLYRNYSKAY